MLIGCLADVNVGNQYKFVKNIGDTGGKWYICNAFLCNRTWEDEVLIRESAAFGHSKNVTFSAESFRKLPVADKPWDMYIGMIAAPMLSKGRWNFKGALLVLQSEKQKYTR